MTKQDLFGASLAVLLLAAPAGAFAQDQDKSDEVSEVITTASITQEGVKRDLIGGSATVLSADDLEQRGVVQIGDVLRDVPGIAVSRSGCGGCQVQVRIRGAEANHTLVLIDGMNLANPVGRETDFSTLFSEDGARVEVLRGQQSALYGSEAIGGVVQYFTPDGRTAPGLRARAEYGSFNSVAGNLSYGGQSGKLDYIVSLSGYNTDGTTDTRAGTRDLANDNLGAQAKLHYQIGEAARLTAVVRANKNHYDFNSATDASGVLIDSPPDGGVAENVLGKLDLQIDNGAFSHNVAIQGMRADNYSTSFGSPFDMAGTRQKATYVGAYTLTQGALKHKFTFSLDHSRETFRQTFDPVNHKLTNTGVVGMYDLTWNDNSAFGASLRNDSPSAFKSFTSYRVQATHKFATGTRIRAAAGTGSQYPTQFELYGFSGTFLGNANLKPEKSEGWEAGIEQSFLNKSVLFGATYFKSKLTDKISSVGFPISTPVNIAGVSNQEGVELFAQVNLDNGISVDAAYTYLDSTDGTPPVATVRRAKNVASLNVNWSPADLPLRINANIRYNGDQFDNRFPFGPPFVVRETLPAFTVVNLNAEWKFSDKLTVYGRADNLFDERYEEVYSFVAPGREISVGLKAKF